MTVIKTWSPILGVEKISLPPGPRRKLLKFTWDDTCHILTSLREGSLFINGGPGRRWGEAKKSTNFRQLGGGEKKIYSF